MQQVEPIMDPELFEILQALTGAIIGYTPDGITASQCVMELGSVQGTQQLFIHTSSLSDPSVATFRPSDELAHAGESLLAYFLEKEGLFPGFRIVVEQQTDDTWRNVITRLDQLDDFESPIPRPLERYHVRISGYGATFMPAAPFQWYQFSEPAGLNAMHLGTDEDGLRSKHQLLIPIRDGIADAQVGDAEHIYKSTKGPSTQAWQIETPLFTCVWPAMCVRVPAASETYFDLVETDNSLIYVQGPFSAEEFSLDDAAAPDQEKTSSGTVPCDWVELSYQIAGENWKQRHYQVAFVDDTILCVSAQSPVEREAEVFAAADEVARSLRPISR